MTRRSVLAGAGLLIALAAGLSARADRQGARPTTRAGVTRQTGHTARLPDRTTWLRDRLADRSAGPTLVVPAGRYYGPFVIDRSLHLQADGEARLIGDRTTHTVAITAADVTLQGFDISASGLDLAKDQAAVHVTGARAVIVDNHIHDALHGVYVRQADDVRIERNLIVGTERTVEEVDPLATAGTPGAGELCEIDLNQNRRGNGVHVWNSRGHVIAGNTIRHTRDGIYFSFVDGSAVRDNDIAGVRYGLHYMYSDDNQFEGNLFVDNAAGAALMSSKHIVLRRNRFLANQGHRSYGILLQTVDQSTLQGNEIVGNTTGVFIESGNANRLLHNTIARNHIGIHVSDSSDENGFAGNVFLGNLHTVETSGGNRASVWAVDGRGNHWDTAVAIDLDGNGVADVPHRELDLFGRTRREFPVIGLLAGSPGERLLRFVHARLALPGLPTISDPAPLVHRGRP